MAASDTVSRKSSIASTNDDASIDQSVNVTSNFSSSPDTLTSPVDEIRGLIQNIYDKKLKLSVKDMQFIDIKVHEMKNRIINYLLIDCPNSAKNATRPPPSQEAIDHLNTEKWPPLPKTRSRSTLLIKSDASKKFEASDVSQMECEVNNLITKQNINATISSSSSTKTGDIVIRFDQKDDVKVIARKVESEMGYRTQSRPVSLPKLTMSYVPKYISVKTDSVAELLIKSNPWLEDYVKDGETFDVLFMYEVRDWKSIVLKCSPKIRSEIIRLGNTLRIENRRCPVKDRFHIQQCGKCLAFGHKTRACVRDQSCAHCSGGHGVSACPVKSDKSKLLCSNCNKSSENVNMDKDHSAYSKSCPLYSKLVKRQIEVTHWGNGPVPNL